MVVGFACAGTENTWCARRTLPHAQFILLIFQGLKLRSAVWRWQRPNRGHATRAVAKPARKKAATPSNTAPPAVGCAVRTKEKSSDAVLSPMLPDNKAVQPCLARQVDIRRTISFDSPAALSKFAKQKKSDLSREQYDWLQRAVARGR